MRKYRIVLRDEKYYVQKKSYLLPIWYNCGYGSDDQYYIWSSGYVLLDDAKYNLNRLKTHLTSKPIVVL